ncbi:MgtC/SapB family protein [Pseudomonas antarctica]|uniref:MgtC/SapB family protein n=1 Tax=Pseudomonas antarctica TaxID=219572 RepID=UPI00387AC009
MTLTLGFTGAAAALGIGMLVGLERERHKGQGERRAFAGLRTYAITALLGYVTQHVGGALLLGLIALCLAVLVSTAYWKAQDKDPGITSEVALFTVLVLGALCAVAPELAAAIGVITAGLLSYREKLHLFARSQLTDGEMRDGLLLLIVALVVLPLTPDRFIGPYGAVNPRTICTLTVLLMVIGAVGHVAVRALGARYGYAVGAIASGFASSTVTIATLGPMAVKEPVSVRTFAAAAIFSNLATVTQVGLILGTVEPALLAQMVWPLLAGFITTAVYGACLMLRLPTTPAGQAMQVSGAFDLKLALMMVLTLTGITFVSSVMLYHFGQAGVMLTATLSGLADAHAATASIAALATSGQLTLQAASIPVLLAVSCNSLSKCVVAWVSGGRRFAAYVIAGQSLLTGAMWLGLLVR